MQIKLLAALRHRNRHGGRLGFGHAPEVDGHRPCSRLVIGDMPGNDPRRRSSAVPAASTRDHFALLMMMSTGFIAAVRPIDQAERNWRNAACDAPRRQSFAVVMFSITCRGCKPKPLARSDGLLVQSLTCAGPSRHALESEQSMTKTVTVTAAASPVPKPLGNLPGGAMPSVCTRCAPAVNAGHTSDRPVELVCSNSMGSTLPDRVWASSSKRCSTWAASSFAPPSAMRCPREAPWLQPRRLRRRDHRSRQRTPQHHGRAADAADIPDGLAIIATGPLTSDQLTSRIQALTGQQHLYFYDAMALHRRRG